MNALKVLVSLPSWMVSTTTMTTMPLGKFLIWTASVSSFMENVWTSMCLQQLPHANAGCGSLIAMQVWMFLGSGAGLKVFIHREWLEKLCLSWWLLIWDDSPPTKREV